MPQSPRAVGFKIDREPRRVVTFRLDVDLIEVMNDLRDREGIQPSEQARRAIREWLVRKRVTGKASASGRSPAGAPDPST